MTYVYRLLVQVDMETGARLEELHNKLGMSKNKIISEAINQLYTTIAEKKGEEK